MNYKTAVEQVEQPDQEAVCSGCSGKGEVERNRGTIVVVPCSSSTTHPERDNSDAAFDFAAGPLLPPSSPKKNPGTDRSRQRWCRQKALWAIAAATGPGQSFDAAFARVRRRWPVSTAGSDFEDTARRTWATQIEKDRIEQERFERQRRAPPLAFDLADVSVPSSPPSPPSPPLSGLRRLIAIRRMAGAPLDPDETAR